MCGRFSLAKDALELAEALPDFDWDDMIQPRYNVAPSQPLVTVLNDDSLTSTFTLWGLIPYWAKDPTKFRFINARCETIASKPSWKGPFRRKRCLIPADGYFEWRSKKGRGEKQALYVKYKDHRPFMMAGLYDEWHDADGGLYVTSTIVTTIPNEVAVKAHHRMPVILSNEACKTWLDRGIDDEKTLKRILQPCSADEMEMIEVSSRVNRPIHDDLACIEPEPTLFD